MTGDKTKPDGMTAHQVPRYAPHHGSSPLDTPCKQANSKNSEVELQPLTPSELLAAISSSEQNESGHVLVIDVRPYTMYAFSHIRSAISICIPSTLLKRQTFGFSRIVDFVSPCDVQALHKASEASHVVFYDQFTTKVPTDSSIWRTAAKFADASKEHKLYWLVGGLTAVSRDTPELIEAGDAVDSLSTQQLVDDEPEQPRLILTSVKAAPRSPFSLVPIVTSDNKLYQSPISAGAISPRLSLDQSSRIVLDAIIANRLQEMPKWLVDAVKLTEQGQNVLAEAFCSLQFMEKQRMCRVTPDSVSTPIPGFGKSSPSSPSISHSDSFDSSQSFALVTGDDPLKNRYTNIAPYLHNAVRVRGEYLNASVISSRESPLRYIATQAPTPAAFGDFWWGVWEQSMPVIVMLTTLRTDSGQIKGHNYWYNSVYDGLEVELVSEKYHTDGIILRRIILTLGQQKREVVHIQYLNWPDLGCPSNLTDVLDLVELKRQVLNEAQAPENSFVAVHCSAGCGRTGTFCAIDTITNHLQRVGLVQAQQEDRDKVFDVVSQFREQRMAMVQNQRQLQMCYHAVMLWFYRWLESNIEK